METIRISVAQINLVVGDMKSNTEKVMRYIKSADELGSDIVLFPEMCITGYPAEDLLLKKHFIKDSLDALKQITKYAGDITVVLGSISVFGTKIHNSAYVLRHKKIAGIYNKMNLPNYSVFDEKRYFKEGDKPVVFKLGNAVFGINICEDIWHDKNVMDAEIKLGAKVILGMAASPFYSGKNAWRASTLSKKSKRLKTYIVYCNMVGGQDELVFDGGSAIYSNSGKIVQRANQFEEALITSDIFVPESRVRENYSIIDLGAKRRSLKPELSGGAFIENSFTDEIYKALVLGTRDYVRKNGFSKVIIGLSGGIDSALTSVIAVDAIGKENVVAMTMPSKFSSSDTRKDALLIAGNLGIKCFEMPIDGILEGYMNGLEPVFKSRDNGLVVENLQARIRGNLMMALSNKFGWLVLTTGNKSETSVGYCTLYGDMAGGFAVIKDVPKTLVYKLTEHVNVAYGYDVIPKSVIKRDPSAELRPNQKDSDSIPKYEVLDEIIKYYVEEDRSFGEILKKTRCSKSVLQDVIRKIDMNEYKRRQSPPGIKITPKAFGKDRRLPITNKYVEY